MLCQLQYCCCQKQPCVVVSLASTSLAWSDWTAPRLHPLQLLLPNYIRFSLLLPDCARFSLLLPDCARFSLLLLECFSLLSHIRSSKYNTKVACHYCSPAPQTSHFCYTRTDYFNVLIPSFDQTCHCACTTCLTTAWSHHACTICLTPAWSHHACTICSTPACILSIRYCSTHIAMPTGAHGLIAEGVDGYVCV